MPEAEDLQLLRQRALDWARRAADGGWIEPLDIVTIEQIDQRLPDSLFDVPENRPLVVALFGGTGVGKSTLLNRLAGQDIAQTGVVRPTSREISVFVHEAVTLRHLSGELPIDRVRVISHASDRYRHVLWIDMPDFDSTDRSNHDLALGWLPHIDLLIYVVSPERYRDDRGWRLLLQNERMHAWVFVMNQSDRGHPAQIDDFRELLKQGGFADPVIYRTACRPHGNARDADQFVELENTIVKLAEGHAFEELARHNLDARIRAARDALGGVLGRLGERAACEQLGDAWHRLWQETAGKLRRGLEWPIKELSARFVQREADPLRRSLDLSGERARQTDRTGTDGIATTSLLWDDWTQLCFDNALERLAVEADRLGLPPRPLMNLVQPLRTEASRIMLDHAQIALRQALARPGHALQRVMLKLAGLIAVLAPLAALGWVGYEVVARYYQSVQMQAQFLGTDFAIHSALLVAVAWGLPYFVYRRLRPSAESAAQRGLQQGLELALEQLSNEVESALSTFRDRRDACRAEGATLLPRVTETSQALRSSAPDDADLSRFISRAG